MNDVGQRESTPAETSAAPREIKVAAGLIGGIGIAFALVAVLRVLGTIGVTSIVTPVVSAVFGVAVAAGLLARKALARVGGFAVLVLFAMLHALIAVADGPWWIRVFSLLAAAGYAYAGVLLTTRPVREYLGGKA